MWETYQNHGGNSDIHKYRINNDSLDVMFMNGSVYRYPLVKIGRNHLSNLINFAKEGQGLLAYIMKNPEVKKGYIIISS